MLILEDLSKPAVVLDHDLVADLLEMGEDARVVTRLAEMSRSPPDTVRHYVVTHEEAPVHLDREVVTGVTLPDTVVLGEVPDYQYRYVNVNGLPVLVEPQSRQIVYVMR